MAIFVTSDWHFNHDKDFVYQPRGCHSVEEMNDMIIRRHNSLVHPNDEVYVLGDLILGGNGKLEEGIHLIEQMNGQLHIIRGNHDTDTRWTAYAQLYPKVVELNTAQFLKVGKYHFFLCHFPAATANYDDNKPWAKKTVCLCGHSHTLDKYKDIQMGAYHVDIDAHFGFPTSIEEIIEDLKEIYVHPINKTI